MKTGFPSGTTFKNDELTKLKFDISREQIGMINEEHYSNLANIIAWLTTLQSNQSIQRVISQSLNHILSQKHEKYYEKEIHQQKMETFKNVLNPSGPHSKASLKLSGTQA